MVKQVAWIVIFSIATGYLESMVVVYLKEIYYPQGFAIPLVPIKRKKSLQKVGFI